MKYIYLGEDGTCNKCNRHYCSCIERQDGTWENSLAIIEYNFDPELNLNQ